MVGRIDIARFRAGARRSAEWSRGQLDDHAMLLFEETPLMMEGEDALFVHAETPAPEDYGYVEEADDAQACFRAADARFVFLGHTHVPGTFILGPDGTVVEDLRSEVTAEPGHRYLVNVGSVGDPRDGTDRASYVIYDVEAARIEFRQIPFDTAAFLAALRKHPELEIPLFCRGLGAGQGARAKDEAMTATKVALVKVERVLNRPRIRVRRSALAGIGPPVESRPATPASRRAPAAPRRRRSPAFHAAVVIVIVVGLGLAVAGILYALREAPDDVQAAVEAPGEPEAAPAAPAPAIDPHREAAMRSVIDALSVVTLGIDKAEHCGKKFRVEVVDGVPGMGFWSDPADYLLWRIRPPRAAVYDVEFNYAVDTKNAGQTMLVAAGRSKLNVRVASTGSWQSFTNVRVGSIELPAGLAVIEVRPAGKPFGGVINLRGITLRPVSKPSGDGATAR